MHTYYFEKLEVWQEARVFAKELYLETNLFPKREQYGLIDQIRRATLSIAANIAEGMSRDSKKEKVRFINIAYSSAMEVINFLILSLDLEYIQESGYLSLRKRLEKITNQLNALCKSLSRGDVKL